MRSIVACLMPLAAIRSGSGFDRLKSGMPRASSRARSSFFYNIDVPGHFLQMKGDALVLGGVQFGLDSFFRLLGRHDVSPFLRSRARPPNVHKLWRAGWLSCLFRKAPQHGGNGGQLARIKLVYQGHKFRHLLRGRWRERCWLFLNWTNLIVALGPDVPLLWRPVSRACRCHVANAARTDC